MCANNCLNDCNCSITTSLGPQGPAGTQGIQGIQGGQGLQGAQGDAGLTGSTGLTGSAGTNGTNGTDGINGTDGVDNMSIICFFRTSIGDPTYCLTTGAWTTIQGCILPAGLVKGEKEYLDIDISLVCSGPPTDDLFAQNFFRLTYNGFEIRALNPVNPKDQLVDLMGSVSGRYTDRRIYDINIKLYRKTTDDTQVRASWSCSEFPDENGVVTFAKSIIIDNTTGISTADLEDGGPILAEVKQSALLTLGIETFTVRHIKN